MSYIPSTKEPRGSGKPKLFGEEYLQLKKRLNERKKALKKRFKIELNGFGKLTTIENSKNINSFSLIIDDIQKLLINLISHNNNSLPNAWCQLKSSQFLEKISVIFIPNFSLEEYKSKQDFFEDSLNQFPIKVIFEADTANNNLIEDISWVSLTKRKRSELIEVYKNLNIAVDFDKSYKKVKTKSNTKSENVNTKHKNNLNLSNDKFSRLQLLMCIKDMTSLNYPIPPLYKSQKKQLPGFKKTKKYYSNVTKDSPMFAIDCEMCETNIGEKELTRISVVNEAHETVYDTLVKPSNPIVDYLTRYSGITEELLENCNVTLKMVQKKIQQIIPDNAILVGHSLNFDLQAMKMYHPYVIDTSIIYNLSGMSSIKPRLKHLANNFLGLNIQEQSHCSTEDALATMKLVQKKLANNIFFGDNTIRVFDESKKKNKYKYCVNISSYFTASSMKSAVIGNEDTISNFQFRNEFYGYEINVNNNIKQKTCECFENNYRIVLSSFQNQSDDAFKWRKYLKKLNKYIREIWNQICNENSICIVITGPRPDSKNGTCFIQWNQNYTCSS